MSLPASQDVAFLYSGAVACSTTSQIINTITGMMRQVGWAPTGSDNVLRSLSDDQGRFFEMEVRQNPDATLSNHVLLSSYRRTKAENNGVLHNAGFQLTTGNNYKIHTTPYSVNIEQAGGAEAAYAGQLYCFPTSSGVQSAAILSAGSKNTAGSNIPRTYFTNNAVLYWGGISGALDGGDDYGRIWFAANVGNQLRGGRAFIYEPWIINGVDTDGIIGRPYGVLSATINGAAGFDIPSGTGTVSYVRMEKFTTTNRNSLCIRTA